MFRIHLWRTRCPCIQPGTLIAGILLALITSQSSSQSISGGQYTVRKQVIAAGGASVQSAPYRSNVTIGEAVIAVSQGGSYRLTSGFHPAPQRLGLLNDRLFCNGFEDTTCPGALQ